MRYKRLVSFGLKQKKNLFFPFTFLKKIGQEGKENFLFLPRDYTRQG